MPTAGTMPVVCSSIRTPYERSTNSSVRALSLQPSANANQRAEARYRLHANAAMHASAHTVTPVSNIPTSHIWESRWMCAAEANRNPLPQAIRRSPVQRRAMSTTRNDDTPRRAREIRWHPIALSPKRP